MSGLPVDIPARIAKALGSGDQAACADLAGRIAEAQADGSARGFGADIDALRKVAGLPPLEKRVSPDLERPLAKGKALPHPMQSRCDVLERAIAHASCPLELAKVTSDGRSLLAEMKALAGLQKALGEPRKGFAPR